MSENKSRVRTYVKIFSDFYKDAGFLYFHEERCNQIFRNHPSLSANAVENLIAIQWLKLA